MSILAGSHFTTAITNTATGSTWINLSNGSSSATTTASGSLAWFDMDGQTLVASEDVYRTLRAGRSYDLPDGSKIKIDDDGNYEVIDGDAKVVYKACRILAFNRFLNASELLEQFIADLAPHGVKQSQVLKVPVEAFINWLIAQAARADGDEPPRQRHQFRCVQCKRFLPTKLIAQGVNFCSAQHLDRYLAMRSMVPA